jgi:hypothetical protein
VESKNSPSGKSVGARSGWAKRLVRRSSKSEGVSDRSRNLYRGKARGADSVILGCTEICLLVGPPHIDVPVFDSTLLHADAAVEFSMTKQGQRPRAAQGVPS